MNQTDLPSIRLNNICEYKSRRVIVSAAELKALNATPKELVPAPGSGKVNEFLGMAVTKEAGTAYAGIASGEDLAVKYTDGSGAQVNTSLETTGFLDSTSKLRRISRPIVTEYTPVENAALVLHMLSGEITTGTGNLIIEIAYRIWHDLDSLNVADQDRT